MACSDIKPLDILAMLSVEASSASFRFFCAVFCFSVADNSFFDTSILFSSLAVVSFSTLSNSLCATDNSLFAFLRSFFASLILFCDEIKSLNPSTNVFNGFLPSISSRFFLYASSQAFIASGLSFILSLTPSISFIKEVNDAVDTRSKSSNILT